MPCGLRLGLYVGYFSKKCPKNSVDFPNRNGFRPAGGRWIVDRKDFVFFKISSNSSTVGSVAAGSFFLEQAPIGSSLDDDCIFI